MQAISRTRIACAVILCTISAVAFTAATLEPQEPEQEALEPGRNNKLHFTFESSPWIAKWVSPEAHFGTALLRRLSPFSVKSESASCVSCHAGSADSTERWTRLGLDDGQKTRVDRAMEYHRQTILKATERLEGEETKLAGLIEADPIDRVAVLTQLDRVLQARGETERTNAALVLELREYLTQDQWRQLGDGPHFAWYEKIEKIVDIEMVREEGGRGFN